MSRVIRYGLAPLGVLALILAAGFFVQASWATWVWPWPDSRLSYVFIASIAFLFLPRQTHLLTRQTARA